MVRGQVNEGEVWVYQRGLKPTVSKIRELLDHTPISLPAPSWSLILLDAINAAYLHGWLDHHKHNFLLTWRLRIGGRPSTSVEQSHLTEHEAKEGNRAMQNDAWGLGILTNTVSDFFILLAL